MKRPLALAALALGCRTPTEITVEIASDVGYRSDMKVAVAVDAPERAESAAPRTTVTTPWAAGGSLGSVVLLPNDDGGEVLVRVALATARDPRECKAGDASGCVVVRRRMRFVRAEATRARIVLRPACLGVFCDATSSCGTDGSCGGLDSDEATGDGGGRGRERSVRDRGARGSSTPLLALRRARGRHDRQGPDRARGRDVRAREARRDGRARRHAEHGRVLRRVDVGGRREGRRGPAGQLVRRGVDSVRRAGERAVVERVDVVESARFGFRVSKPSDKPAAFSVFRGADTYETTAPATKFAGYSHVVAVTRGATIQLYVNGNEAPASAAGGAPSAVLGPLLIGASRSGAPSFRGTIDEVAIYDYPLTRAQIETHASFGLRR